jgi:hypothetical protein
MDEIFWTFRVQNSHTKNGQPQTRLKELLNFLISLRVWETFELNQLKSAPSQLLSVFSGLDWLQTYCH